MQKDGYDPLRPGLMAALQSESFTLPSRNPCLQRFPSVPKLRIPPDDE